MDCQLVSISKCVVSVHRDSSVTIPTTQPDREHLPVHTGSPPRHLSAFFSNLAPMFDLIVKGQLRGCVTASLDKASKALHPQRTPHAGGALRMVIR